MSSPDANSLHACLYVCAVTCCVPDHVLPCDPHDHPFMCVTKRAMGCLLSLPCRGGRFLSGGQSWYWSYSHTSPSDTFPANDLLSRWGITQRQDTVTAGGLASTVSTLKPRQDWRELRRLYMAMLSLCFGLVSWGNSHVLLHLFPCRYPSIHVGVECQCTA
jgi:hypothetical protein